MHPLVGGSSGNPVCKRSVILFGAVAFLFTLGLHTSAQIGLKLAYSFDESSGTVVTDSSSSLINGTLVNGVVRTAGRVGNALRFDASDNGNDGDDPRVQVGTAFDVTLPSTFSAWVNPVNYSDYRAIFSKRDSYASANMRVEWGLNAGSGAVYFGRAGSLAVFGYSPPVNTWTYLAVTADSTGTRLYVNGALQETRSAITFGTKATANAVIGGTGEAASGDNDPFRGMIDEFRIYSRVLTQAEIQTDMNTPIGGAVNQPPNILSSQPSGPLPSGTTSTTLIVTTNETATCKYSTTPNTSYSAMLDIFTTSDGLTHQAAVSGLQGGATYNYYVRCLDQAGSANASDYAITFSIAQSAVFVHEWVVSEGLAYPRAIEFLPDGRLLIAQLDGVIRLVQAGATQLDPTPVVQLSNVYVGNEAGLLDLKPDPNFATNGFVYVFYVTSAQGTKDRLARLTMVGNTIAPGSEVILWQGDPDNTPYHHGSGIAFGPDGKLYFTTGDHNFPNRATDLGSDLGKLMRINVDGTVPSDNPFFDGAGPNKDAIWAYGLRNPSRISLDSITGNIYMSDSGGPVGTSFEEIDIASRGAHFGWPNCDGPCAIPGTTNPLYSWSHAGRDSSVTGGLVYRGTQFPATYQGSYIFGDYAQNWIRRLTLNAAGNSVTSLLYVAPGDATLDDPSVGDPVDFAVGPDGALYYVDFDFAESEQAFNSGGVRRIRYVVGNQPPVAVASANITTGPAPLQVSFFSTGTTDPDSGSLSYQWSFGDGGTSTAANPVHTYNQKGQFTVSLTVSDGTSSSHANPIVIQVGAPPTPTITMPVTGVTFRAGDVISFAGNATDPEDGTLPPSAFEWTINFLHDTHTHPEASLTSTTTGTLSIPTSGHDYVGNTRYEIVLTVTDSDGLQATTAVTLYPEKATLNFDTVPSGLTIRLDGINIATPFSRRDLIGFQHTIDAPSQVRAFDTYNFASWSDGGAHGHTIVVPSQNQSYVATYTVAAPPTTPGSLGATAVGTQINLAWTASTSAVGIADYSVERCQGPGCSSFAVVGVAPGPSFSDLGLTQATTYQYRVRARDTNNTFSTYSNVASATTSDTSAPTPPANLIATAGSTTQITLTWTASTDNVGVTTYRLERCQSIGCSTFTEIATPAASPFTNTGLSPSTSYSYRLRAADAAGNLSAYSTVATISTQTPPAAGGPVLALAFDEGTGTTTADASGSGNSGTLVSGPTWVAGHTSAALSFDGVDDKVSLPSSLDIPTLPFTLEAWVRPTNYSSWHVIFSKRSAYSAAGMRLDVGLRTGNGRVFLTNGSATLTSTYAPPVNTWTHLAVVVDSVSTRLYVNSALQQTLASIALGTGSGAAVNIGRTGDNDDPFAGAIDDLRLYKRALTIPEIQSDMVTPVVGAASDTTPPIAPTSVNATVVGNTRIDLTWTPSTDNIGVTGYRVERCPGVGCSSFIEIGAPLTASFSDAGLTTGTSYTYRVRANDSAGNLSDFSTPVSVVLPPSAPTALSALASSGTQIGLTWTASTSSIGIVDYAVERCQGLECANFVQIGISSNLAFGDSGLTSATLYVYRVRARDTNGVFGPYSSTAIATTTDTIAPTAPSSPVASAVSISQITVTWTASSDNVAVTGYRVERCTGAGCSSFAEVAAPIATLFNDTGLAASTSYSYRVRALDGAGNLSPFSATASANTGTIPPTTPGSLGATAVGTQINLAWTASTSAVGIADYSVERCQGPGCSSFAVVGVAPGPSFSDLGLTQATTYQYRVRARDTNNTFSTYSNVASATTSDTSAPTPPANLIATAGSTTQITLTWTASTDNVGVTTYRLERCQSIGCSTFTEIATPAASPFTNTGLSPSTSYSYRLRAADAAGNLSAYSTVATISTQTPPAAGGPVLALAFDEGTGTTTADASGSGNSGTLVSGPTWVAGHTSAALSFDGVDDKVSLPSSLDIPTLPFTLEAWVRPTNYSSWHVIFSKRSAYSAAGMRLDVGLDRTTGRVYLTSATQYLTSTYAPPVNTWTHLAVVADSTGTRIYANGVLQQTLAVTTLGSSASAPVSIGRTGDNDDAYLGLIDDVRLYRRVLTLAEIQADMNTPVTAGAPQPADLTLAKTHSGTFTQGQPGVTYSLAVSNVGAGATNGAVTLTDNLPTGLTATAMAGTGWTCAVPTLTCTRSDVIPAGGSYPPVTVTLNVDATAPSSVTNSATVSGGGDVNSANNTALDPTSIESSTPGSATPPVFVNEVHSATDGAGPGFSESTLSLNVTGANSLVIAAWHSEFDGGLPDSWTVTLNGVPGTPITELDGYTGGAGNRRFRTYYWVNPSSGTNTLFVGNPWAGANELSVSAIVLNNVSQANPLGAVATDVSTQDRTSESETVPTVASDLVVHVIAYALVTQGQLGPGEISRSVANDGLHAPEGDASIWISTKAADASGTTTTVSSSGWARRVLNGVGIVVHGR